MAFMWILLLLLFNCTYIHGLSKKFEIKSLIGNHTLYLQNVKTLDDLKRSIANQINLPVSIINLHRLEGASTNNQLIGTNERVFGLSLSLRGGMSVTVKTLTGSNITVDDISDDDTVLKLKQKISKMQNMPIDHQRLIFNGRMLKDGKKLSDYKIKDKAVVHLVLRLRGGKHDL